MYLYNVKTCGESMMRLVNIIEMPIVKKFQDIGVAFITVWGIVYDKAFHLSDIYFITRLT